MNAPLQISLQKLPGRYSVHKLPADATLPSEVLHSKIFWIARTPDELSLVVQAGILIPNAESETDWFGFRVSGTLNFALTGIIYRLTKPLNEAKIPVLVVSTFDTDYLFVRENVRKNAVNAWKMAGINMVEA